MQCPKCGTKYNGGACPACGGDKERAKQVIEANYQRNKRRAALIVIVIVGGIVLAALLSELNKPRAPAEPATIETFAVAQSEHLSSYSKQLSSGHYVAGMDIPAGTYNIKAVKGRGNVYSTNAYDGGLNEIMGTASDDVQSFDNCELPAGTVLSVINLKISIKSDDADVDGMQARDNPAKDSVTLQPGNYTAGTDFAAGAYDIVASSGSGNVYSDNTERGINAIMGTKEDDMYIKEFLGVLLEDGTKITVDGVTVHLNPSK